MKLETTEKLLSQKSNKIFFSLLFVLIFVSPIFSQPSPMTFKNTPLSEALNEIAHSFDVRISFDSGELQEHAVSKTVSGNKPLDLFKTVLENFPYHVEYKYNTYLILKNPRSGEQENTDEILVSGLVYDKHTGERLPYATIRSLTTDRTFFSNLNGSFTTPANKQEKVYLQVSYLGYFSLDTVVGISSDNKILELGLVQKSQTIQTIEVKADKFRMVDLSKQAGHFSFNPSRFSDLPNYGEVDIFKALQLLPGISMQENSSQLNIRGSSADQTLVLFDGFTLYNLDHFFGVFSALNPNIVKNIQVYRGGFDSRYGERISGIVDITAKAGNKQKTQLYGGINLISGNLTAEIPVTEKITFVGAARRAYSDIYSSWLTDEILNRQVNNFTRLPADAPDVVEPEFYFNDYNLKLTFQPDNNENLSVSFYGANDYLNSSNISEDTRVKIETEDLNEWGNYGMGADWEKQWNKRYFTRLQLGHSGYLNNYFNESVIAEITSDGQTIPDTRRTMITNENNKLSDYFVSLQNEYFLNENNQLEFGGSVKYNRLEFYKDASREIVYTALENSSRLLTGFIQDKISLKNRWFVKPGIRVSFYEKTGNFYAEPRLAVNYKSDAGISYKFATGRYYQFINKSATEQTYGYNREFWILSDGKNHPVVSSNHFIVGANYDTKNFFFDVEAYYKSIDGIQSYLFFRDPESRNNFGAPPPEGNGGAGLSKFISGKGEAYGIDFLAKYEKSYFTSWLAYSLSKSVQVFDEINDGSQIPANFDRPHELKWTNIFSKKRWTFSSLVVYTSGTPYIKTGNKNDNFEVTRTYNRLPEYFRTDFSLNYQFNFKGWNIKPGVSVLNAMNTANYLDIYTREFDFQNQELQRSTLIKAQDLTFNFFVNFRF